MIGPNGGGKSTLLKCLTGRLRPKAGQVFLDGHDVTAAGGTALTKSGLGYVPQHNDIFPTLTVRENLEMGGYLLPKARVGERIDYVLQTFPTLQPLLKRSGKLLSGGERKLLGIGRSLISSPKLLILDEPTAGLSPILARSMLDDHVTSLARAGVTILLVEQRAHQAMQVADWCYVMVAGRVELNDAPAALLARPDFGELFLGRSARGPQPDRRTGTCPRPPPARPPPARIRPVTMRADRPRSALHPRPWLEHIEPYRPGLPAASDDGSLAANESPFGASARVVTAITSAASQAHRYPDPLAGALRAELAALHGVHPDQILVGNGSDELIFLLAWAYLAQQGHAVCADPPYRIDEVSTHVVGARLTRVPLRDWAHDLDAMARITADIIYLVNPHNPTGTVRSRAEIEHFVQASPAGLIVVDEAYVEFTDDPDATTCLPLVASGRVAVLRTFSKIHGLAGLRVGYLIADPGIIATLRKIRAPFSVGTLAQAGALAALGDPGHAAQARARTRQARAELTRLFEHAGYRVIPSQANFILVQAPDEPALVSRLAEHAIAVRPGTALGIPGTVRVSVPSQRGLRLLHSALRPTSGRPPAG